MLKDFIDLGNSFISNEASLGLIQNLYLQKNGDDFILRGFPGIKLLKTLVSGALVKGIYFLPKSFTASFGDVYIHYTSGTSGVFQRLNLNTLALTTLATIASTTLNKVRFCNNETYILAVSRSSANLFVTTIATDAFTNTGSGLSGNIYDCCFIAGFFILTVPVLNKFYFTQNPLAIIPALNFYVTQSERDAPYRCFNVGGFLYILSGQSTEIWQATGDSNFPFQPILNATMKIGCNALVQDTWEQIGDILIGIAVTWTGKYKLTLISREGFKHIESNAFFDSLIANVYETSKQTPISTSFLINVENKIFYCLNFNYIGNFGNQTTTDTLTIVYDFELDVFYFFNDASSLPIIFSSSCLALGHSVIDSGSGKHNNPAILALNGDNNLYLTSQKYYLFDQTSPDTIPYTWITKTIEKPNHQLFDIDSLELLIHQDAFSTIQIGLEVSKDRGLNWIDQGTYNFGTYSGRIMWLRLGIARHFTFRFKILSTGKHIVITDIIINGETQNA